MDNADEFIQLFRKLENWMKERVDKKSQNNFPEMIRILKETYRQFSINSTFLVKIGKLRNVLVHEDFVLAEPSDELVSKFRTLVELIMMPPKLMQYCATELSSFVDDVLLSEVLRHMYKNDYSQVIVKHDENYRLISREGISKWAGANIDDVPEIIPRTKVSEVLAYEDDTNCEYVDSTTDVFTFLDIFSDVKRRVQAIIVTEHGKSNEKPIGIATVWDAGVIIKEMNIA